MVRSQKTKRPDMMMMTRIRLVGASTKPRIATARELAQAMTEMDEDGNGEVDFDEFCAWWKAGEREHDPTGLRARLLSGGE